MQTEKKNQIEKDLFFEINEFYSKADVMSCISSITYLLLSVEEEVDPLTSAENINMLSLMQLLVNLSRLQTTGRPYA